QETGRYGGPRRRGLLHVALENARLREPRQTFAYAACAQFSDAVDGLEIFDAGREELLQRAEVVDEAFDDGCGKSRHLGEQPVAAWRDSGVEMLTGAEPECARDRGEVDQVGRADPRQLGE